MAWVPPCPGMAMGRPARCDTRSMGMTTLREPAPPSGAPAPVVDGPEEVAAAGWRVVAGPVGPTATPSAVTTYAHRPSGEVAMAKFPRSGVPEMGSGMGASAVWVVSSTGVTALVHTT